MTDHDDRYSRWLLRRIVAPIVASVERRGEEFRVDVVRGPCVSDGLDLTALVKSALLVRQLDVDPASVYWARVAVSEEVFCFALAVANIDRALLNRLAWDFVEEFSSWLAETRVGWGELRVPVFLPIDTDEEMSKE